MLHNTEKTEIFTSNWNFLMLICQSYALRQKEKYDITRLRFVFYSTNTLDLNNMNFTVS